MVQRGKAMAQCPPIFASDGGATRPLPRDVSAEELHEDPTVWPHPKVWTRGQKWKKYCQRWRVGGAQMQDTPGGDELNLAEGVRRRCKNNSPSVLSCIRTLYS